MIKDGVRRGCVSVCLMTPASSLVPRPPSLPPSLLCLLSSSLLSPSYSPPPLKHKIAGAQTVVSVALGRVKEEEGQGGGGRGVISCMPSGKHFYDGQEIDWWYK